MSPLLWHASKHEWHGSLRHCWPNRDSSASSMCSSVSAGSLSRTSTGGRRAAFHRWIDACRSTPTRSWQPSRRCSAGPKTVASSGQKPTTRICNSPPTVTLRPNAPTAPTGGRRTCPPQSSNVHAVPVASPCSLPKSVGMRILRRHRRLPFQGQRRRTVPGLRRPRPPRVSAFRRRRTHPARHESQPTVRRGRALEQTTQSL